MPQPSMSGKVALVTGATAGIGRVTARALAERGATVVIMSRNAEKCARVADELRKTTGHSSIEPLPADLSSQTQVRRAAAEFKSRFDRLDVLVNNAGAAYLKRRETIDGIEATFALNHLGYFLLTTELLDLLKRSAPARIVCVASNAHYMAKQGLDFNDIESKRRYRGFPVYGASKLANVLFTRELARRLEGTGVTANALHPGVVATEFVAAMPWVVRAYFKLFGISAEKGAETSIHLATAPEVEGVTGKYFVEKRETKPSRAALDDAAALRLWELSERMTASGAERSG